MMARDKYYKNTYDIPLVTTNVTVWEICIHCYALWRENVLITPQIVMDTSSLVDCMLGS